MNLAKARIQFNQSKVRSFKSKSAMKRYLDPVGLYYKPPTSWYGNNSTPFTREEEPIYFKAFHFVKYKLNVAINKDKNVEFWTDMFFALRNRIACGNSGLVHASARHSTVMVHPDPRENTEQLESIAHEILLKSTERFDPWRGFRFSTYACRAMVHEFVNTSRKNHRPPMIDVTECDAPDDMIDENQDFMEERLTIALTNKNLSEKERKILYMRYFLGLRLQDVGDHPDINLSKERVRQIQLYAVDKLRGIVTEDVSKIE